MEVEIRFKHHNGYISESVSVNMPFKPIEGHHLLFSKEIGEFFHTNMDEQEIEKLLLFVKKEDAIQLGKLYDDTVVFYHDKHFNDDTIPDSEKIDSFDKWWNACKEFDKKIIPLLGDELKKYCKVSCIYQRMIDEDNFVYRKQRLNNDFSKHTEKEYRDEYEIGFIPVIVLEKDEEWYEQHK